MTFINQENWDLYDAKMNFVRTIQKGEVIPRNLYHVTVEVIPTDLQGHMLITQRSHRKLRGPGKYEFPAGSVLSGEEPARAALRELREETGLKPTKLYQIQKARKHSEENEPGFIRITYMAVIPNLTSAVVQLQPEETISYRIVTTDQWYQEIAKGTFDEDRTKMYGARLFENVNQMVGKPAEEDITVNIPKPLTLRKCDNLNVGPAAAASEDEQIDDFDDWEKSDYEWEDDKI